MTDAVPIAATHLYLTTPKLMLDVAHDVARAWKELRGIARGVSFELLHADVARVLWEHRVLWERLSRDPIRGV